MLRALINSAQASAGRRVHTLVAHRKRPDAVRAGLEVVRSVMVGVLEEKKTAPLIDRFG